VEENSLASVSKRKKGKKRERPHRSFAQSVPESSDNNPWIAPDNDRSVFMESTQSISTAPKASRGTRKQTGDDSGELRHTKRHAPAPSQALSLVPNESPRRISSPDSLKGNMFLRKSLGELLTNGSFPQNDQDRQSDRNLSTSDFGPIAASVAEHGSRSQSRASEVLAASQSGRGDQEVTERAKHAANDNDDMSVPNQGSRRLEHVDGQAQKRAKLRPIAPSFVPRLRSAIWGDSQQDSRTSAPTGHRARIASSAFAFASAIPKLRPTAPSFVPNVLTPPPDQRHFIPALAMPSHHGSTAPLPQGTGRPEIVPLAHINPAFVSSGAIGPFAPPNSIACEQQYASRHFGVSAARQGAESMDVSDMFYNRSLSTLKSEHKENVTLRSEFYTQSYDVCIYFASPVQNSCTDLR
jgi:hypothetical protein